MPYNFEATFTQPLLAELDAGKIKDARTWADAITRHYLNTIKLGMPSGVSPVLPAPGLNPGGPPPPFTIGAAPYNTADARKHAMYSVVHAYFFAKELKLQRGSIESTISAIKQLLRKVKDTTARVHAISSQVKVAVKQLEQLPSFFRDLDEGVSLFIKQQVDQVDELLDSIRTTEFAANASPEQFQQLFGEELGVIESLKSFSVTDKAGIARLGSFVAKQGQDSDRVLDSSRREVVIKQHLNKRLVKLVKETLTFIQIPLQPSLFIDYANNLERQSNKFHKLVRAIRQIAFIERFVRPRLAKLKMFIRSLLSNLHNKLQPKILKLQNKLANKVKIFSTKSEEGKRSGLFKRANKTIKSAKRSNASQIAKQTARVKAGKDLIKKTASVSTKIVALTLSVQQEFDQVKLDLIHQRSKSASLQDTSNQLAEAGSTSVGTKIELSKLNDYMEGNGLGSFYQIAAKLVIETGSSAKDVITLLEKRRARYRNYGSEIETLGGEVSTIQSSISVLFGGKPRSSKVGLGLWISERTTSIKCLLERIVKWLKPKLAKITSWLKKFVAQVTTLIKNTLRKVSKALQDLALNLVPTSSTSRDPVNKRNAQRARAKAVRDKATQLKATATRLNSLSRGLPALASLTSNLAQGKLGLAQNQSLITKLSNALYGYKRQGKSPAVQQQLVAEEGKFNNNLSSLMVLESIALTLSQASSTLGQQARVEFNRTIDSIKQTASPASPTQFKSLEVIRQFIQTPPKTIKQIKQAGEAAAAGVVVDVSATNTFVDLEKRVLRTTRQMIQTILEDVNLKHRYQQALACGNTTGLFFSAYTELRKISLGLSKQQSLILMCMRALAKLVTKLLNWIKQSVERVIREAMRRLQAKLARIHKTAEKDVAHRASKGINLDGALISLALGLSTRSFWMGATWTGPTGSNHTCLTVGGFAPKMRAKVEDGATGFVREMAKGFQNQLRLMRGIVTPPPATGIPPIHFVGYN